MLSIWLFRPPHFSESRSALHPISHSYLLSLVRELWTTATTKLQPAHQLERLSKQYLSSPLIFVTSDPASRLDRRRLASNTHTAPSVDHRLIGFDVILKWREEQPGAGCGERPRPLLNAFRCNTIGRHTVYSRPPLQVRTCQYTAIVCVLRAQLTGIFWEIHTFLIFDSRFPAVFPSCSSPEHRY